MMQEKTERCIDMNILKFLLLNESSFASHLWYLGAILHTLRIICFADK